MDEENDDLDGVLEQNDDQQQQQTEPKATPPANDDLRSALAELAGHVKTISTPKTQEPQAPMSEEEKEKLWGVYKPTRKDFFHKFFGLPEDADEMSLKERQELFAEVQQGLVRQSLTGSLNLMKQLREQFDAEYAPLREYVSQARAKETRSAFNTAYPGLADARYDKVLRIVSSDLAKREFKSQDEFFKALAEGAAESIREFVPEFDLGATTNQPKKAPGSTPRLPRTSVGGSGGAGGGGGGSSAGAKRDQSDDIFD
jgi:hypothetical protein